MSKRSWVRGGMSWVRGDRSWVRSNKSWVRDDTGSPGRPTAAAGASLPTCRQIKSNQIKSNQIK